MSSKRQIGTSIGRCPVSSTRPPMLLTRCRALLRGSKKYYFTCTCVLWKLLSVRSIVIIRRVYLYLDVSGKSLNQCSVEPMFSGYMSLRPRCANCDVQRLYEFAAPMFELRCSMCVIYEIWICSRVGFACQPASLQAR